MGAFGFFLKLKRLSPHSLQLHSKEQPAQFLKIFPFVFHRKNNMDLDSISLTLIFNKT